MSFEAKEKTQATNRAPVILQFDLPLYSILLVPLDVAWYEQISIEYEILVARMLRMMLVDPSS